MVRISLELETDLFDIEKGSDFCLQIARFALV
jgi:hypothetical protein